LFIKIFGGKNDKGKNVQGKVIFMDSFSHNYSIKRDIITPHHKNYYNNKGEKENILPLDSDEPTPIQFLVMKKSGDTKLKFEIKLAIDKSIFNNIIQENESINNTILEKYKNKTIYKFVVENLIEALNFHGIGAKTSVGYGYFQEITKEECFKQIVNNEKRREKEILEEKENKKLMKMNNSEKKLYLVKKISDCEKRKEELKKLFANREQEELEQTEVEELAKLIKKIWNIRVNGDIK
jgi:CRISPR-associated protein Cmr6